MNIDKNTMIKFNILAIICIILISIVMTPIKFQNDTYYTIKIGEHIINNGIDMKDPFSWNEDLPYTYPHWAYDVGTYLIFNLGQNTGIEDGGFLFLTIATAFFSCTLGVLIYIVCCKISKNNLISFFLTILVMYLMRDFIAARAQLITFNLFVLTVFFIESFLDSKKKRYLIGLVLISIAIANIHVAVWPFFFVLFLPYIVADIFAWMAEKNIISECNIARRKLVKLKIEKKIKKQKNEEKLKLLEKRLEDANKKLEDQEEKEKNIIEKLEKRRNNPYKIQIKRNTAVKWLVIIAIICVFTGLLTPLGDTPYTYLPKTMQGNTMKSISEHLPLTLYNDTEMMIVLALVLAILIFTDTKIKLQDLFMMAGLVFLLFMSRRQISLFLIIGVFIFAKWLHYLASKYDKGGCEKFLKKMTTLLGKTITICVIALICTYFVKFKMNDTFIDKSKYPVEASTWILENLDLEKTKLYNEYNYGSYLLYRGIPVFIDSRADLYAPEFNKKDNEEKGRDIFTDYTNIAGINTYYENKFDEYGITHAIVVNNSKLRMFLSRNDEYKQLYKDDYFTIYERIKND